jgi:hypothetical protein
MEEPYGARAWRVTREGFFVRVNGARVTELRRVWVPIGAQGHEAVREERISTADAAGEFEKKLRGRGLSESETGGFLASWRKEFFETEGARVLMFLDGKDYDGICPLRVRPKPTEVVRVGVVWVEF